MSQLGTAELLERDAELALIAERIRQSRDGAGSLLILEGAPGIGKTSLLRAALARARSSSMTVLSARGSELEQEFPFGIVRQLFEPLVAPSGAPASPGLFVGAAELAQPLLTDPDLTKQGFFPADASYAALHGLYWLTANAAAASPLMLAVDDAHWCDAPSLRFLAYLVKRVTELPIVIVIATRTEAGESGYLLEEILSDPTAQTVRPQPLSDGTVTEVVRAQYAPDADETFCRACYDATRGNPFFVRELIGALKEANLDATVKQAAAIAELAPASVARSLRRRLERLPEVVSKLARAIAVIGPEADLRIAAELAGLQEATAREASLVLSNAHILQPTVVEFAHPMVRAAIYSELSPAERNEAHAQAARLFARLGRSEERVAVHLLALEPAGDPWVSETLERAASLSMARGAPDAAATYLRRALAELPLDGADPGLLFKLGLAETSAGFPTGFDHIRQALRRSQDACQRGMIASHLARLLVVMGNFTEAVRILQRAQAEVDDLDPELAARLDAQLLSALMFDPSTVPVLQARLLKLSQEVARGEVSDPLLLANTAVFTAAAIEPAAIGAQLAERALEAQRHAVEEDPFVPIFSTCALMAADRLDSAAAVWEDLLTEAHRTGSAVTFVLASAFRAHLAWRQGDIALAGAGAQLAYGAARLPEVSAEARFGLTFNAAAMIDVLIELGELERADAVLKETGMGGELPEVLLVGFLLDSRGRLRLAQHRANEALADFTESGRRLEIWGVRNPGVFPWRCGAALALAKLGREDDARELIRVEIELARAFDVPRELGMALRTAGLIERGGESVQLLSEAVEVLTEAPSALERARALGDLGAALRRSGQRSRAREPLRLALELAQRNGARAIANAAHNELLAAGARPRRWLTTGVEALTATERRVADLVATGLTNREVAQTLFVTEKTIERHLSQVYRKLGIRSRSQLEAALPNGTRRGKAAGGGDGLTSAAVSHRISPAPLKSLLARHGQAMRQPPKGPGDGSA